MSLNFIKAWRNDKRYNKRALIWHFTLVLIKIKEKNASKNGHIQNVCSMCIKINKVGKQEVGIWWVQKRFPRYGVPIWSLWPNIKSLPSIVAEKNVTKNVHTLYMFNVYKNQLTGPKTLPTISHTCISTLHHIRARKGSSKVNI